MTRRIFVLAILAAATAAAQAPKAAPRAIPSYKDLKYPPLPQIKIPQPTQFTLPNGMRVLLLEDHELPLIDGVAMVRTGNLFDPADKRGLSEITADVMRSGGTKSKTGDQIDQQLEDVAASVESNMGESSASVSFSALKETVDPVLATFKDVLANPEFRQNKLDLELSQMRGNIARRNDDASAIPDRELLGIIYGRNNSYGWQIEYRDLANIHRGDLIDFYRRYYFPKNILLTVYGDFSTAQMKDKLEKAFADWTVEQPPVPPFPAVTAKPAPGIYLGEKDDVTQTFFAIGEMGGTLLDKDYAALEVAANILGQGFTSRLVSRIRTELGYAYDIQAAWAANWDHPGTFRIVGSTKSASTTETIQAVNEEIEKMRAAEVTLRELREAKDSVLNSFVFYFDSPAKTLNRLMRYEYFNYPKDFLDRYRESIDAVTQADVLRVAKEHFLPANLTVVAVGNPKAFGKPLSTLGKVNAIDLTIPEPKQESPKADPASIARGHALLARAQNALGGADKLAAIKDTTESGEGTMQGMKIKQRTRLLSAGYWRQDLSLPIGTMSSFTDGKTGWVSTPRGVMPMPAVVLKQAQGEMFRELPRLMLADQDASLQVSAEDANSAEVSGGGNRVKIEFDPATGLPAREEYVEPGPNGPAQIVETFSDWREVSGVKVPFKSSIEQNGNKLIESSIENYKFNTGLKAEELSQKP
ncbi:MAG: M16 family metallopeptidase [Bryobacteraceae bacterium]